MRPAREVGAVSGDSPSVPVELGRALMLACAWAAAVTLRLDGAAAVAPTALGALGCTALTLGVIAVILRRARPLSDGLRASVAGGALALGPLAFLGSMLATGTHHRALGGVTFAFAAAMLLAAAVVVAVRLGSIARGTSRVASTARGAMAVASAASLGWVLVSLASAFGPGAPAPARGAIVDAACCAALVFVTHAAPPWRLPSRGARAGAALWALAVLSGLIAVRVSDGVSAALAARAPVALGLGALVARSGD
jgi:hypothetical protein